MLEYHKPSSSDTHIPTLTNANTTATPTPTIPNVSEPENLPETVEDIVHELLNNDYVFYPFDGEVSIPVKEGPSDPVNERENEPIEKLVEHDENGETDEDESDSDDSDYFVDEEDVVEEINVDMHDYHFNIDNDVEWVRQTVREEENEDAPTTEDVEDVDNENLDSGSDDDENELEKIRRKKLRELEKANKNADNIKHKYFFYFGQKFTSAAEVKERVRLHSIETRRKLQLTRNDKLRVRAKCMGRIPVFTTQDDGPSQPATDATTKKKVKGKSKKGVGPSDQVEPTKKGISLGGRGMLKPLAEDEFPWVLLMSKIRNSKTWEVRTYEPNHKCLQSRDIKACTSAFMAQGIIDQIEI